MKRVLKMADMIFGKRYSCPECPFATYDAFDFRLHAQAEMGEIAILDRFIIDP